MIKKIIDIKKIERKKSVRKFTTTKLVPQSTSVRRKAVRFKPVKFSWALLEVTSPIKRARKVFVKRVETKASELFFSMKTMQKFALMVIFTFSTSGLTTAGITSAYYTDTESTGGNFLSGSLNVELSENSYEGMLGNTPDQKLSFQTTISKADGVLPTQYELLYQKVDGSDDVCSALAIKATSGDLSYSGAVTNTYAGPTTNFEPWDFEVSVLSGESLPFGQSCSFDLIFSAWMDGVLTSGESGYTDSVRFNVVINTEAEILESLVEVAETDTSEEKDKKEKEDKEQKEEKDNSENKPELLPEILTDAIETNETKPDTGEVAKEVIEEVVIQDEVIEEVAVETIEAIKDDSEVPTPKEEVTPSTES